MSAVNKVILVGNLGATPETRVLPSGVSVTNIRLATTEVRRSKASGQNSEHTEWHRVVFFDKLAEVAAKHLIKGAQIYLEGKLRTRKWQAQDGSDKYMTEVVAHEMQFLGKQDSKLGEVDPLNRTARRLEPTCDSTEDPDIPF